MNPQYCLIISTDFSYKLRYRDIIYDSLCIQNVLIDPMYPQHCLISDDFSYKFAYRGVIFDSLHVY